MPMANRHGRSRRRLSIDAGYYRPMIRLGRDFTDGGKATSQFRQYAAVPKGPVRALSSHLMCARETRAKFAKIEIGAPGRTRTSTMLPPPDFESGASTNSATGA